MGSKSVDFCMQILCESIRKLFFIILILYYFIKLLVVVKNTNNRFTH